jgi:iron(III) transport system substrate-binding protein
MPIITVFTRLMNYHIASVVLICVAGLLVLHTSCTMQSSPEIVVYCALDREFSEPLLSVFEKQTGIRVLAKYDVESTKTVGLANAIAQEQARPRCDLFWNNEILHTLRLHEKKLLRPFQPTQTTLFPATFRDSRGYWYGFAARARVLLVNTELVPESERPDSLDDLIDSRWQGKVGMAKPLFGTTATHAAILFATRGEPQARQFFEQFQHNGVIFSGNKHVAQAVASGEIAFGITDTDDAIAEMEAARPVAIVFPDQAKGECGTLLIPNTLCLPTGTPHSAAAEKLANFLLTAATEERLAAAASAQIPLHAEAKGKSRALPKETPRWMEVDFAAAAKQWETTSHVLTELFSGANNN